MKDQLSLAPILNTDEPVFKDGEGSDGPDVLTQVVIDVAENGYMVTFIYESSDLIDERVVFTDFDEALKAIKARH